MTPDVRFIAYEGVVWRRSEHGWHSMTPKTCAGLLRGFREDAANKADWFHNKAARLADQLEAAVKLADEQRQKRSAA